MIELVIAQDPPAVVRMQEEATALARMALSAGLCPSAGYEVRLDVGRDLILAYADSASDTPGGAERASQTYQGAIAEESLELSRLLEDDHDESAMPEYERMRAVADAITERCRETSRAYPTVVIADGDEAATGDEFITRMRAAQAAE